MKKLFILSFASILLLTGCGATETLSCTYRTDATNGTTKVSYDIDHEQDEIKKVRITYNYNFDTDNNDTDAANETDNNITAYDNDNDDANNDADNNNANEKILDR